MKGISNVKSLDSRLRGNDETGSKSPSTRNGIRAKHIRHEGIIAHHDVELDANHWGYGVRPMKKILEDSAWLEMCEELDVEIRESLGPVVLHLDTSGSRPIQISRIDRELERKVFPGRSPGSPDR